MSCLPFLTVFWPLHGEQCCTFFTIHISMVGKEKRREENGS